MPVPKQATKGFSSKAAPAYSKPVLPFKTAPSQQIAVTIDDGCGNSLEIVKRGSLTYREHAAIADVQVRILAEAEDCSMATLMAEIAAEFLRLRFNAPGVPTEEILTDSTGEPLGWPMVAEIYNFQQQEKSRWVNISAEDAIFLGQALANGAIAIADPYESAFDLLAKAKAANPGQQEPQPGGE